MVKFTFVIPIYNLATYISACLDSVREQTYADWEAVCINDGSSDDSQRILDAYARRDSRIRVFNQINSGEGAARNMGLRVATGNWVIFLDGDDVFAPNALMRIVEIHNAYPDVKLIRFDNVLFNDGDVCIFGNNKLNSVVQIEDVSVKLTMESLHVLATRHVYERSILDGLKFPSYLRGCDRLVITSVLLSRVNWLVSTDEVFYGYRMRNGSAMHVDTSRKILVDEMSHRRDIIMMIEHSHKHVDYATDPWLEGFFTKDVGIRIARAPREERSAMWHDWYSCICQLSDVNGLSRKARFIFRLCQLLPMAPVWWFLCRLLPWCERQIWK